LEAARAQVAACVHAASSSEIVLVSGATESIHAALIGGCSALRRTRGLSRGHIITTSTEHVAVLEVVKHMQAQMNFDVTLLPVDGAGLVTPNQVAQAVRDDTVMVSIMLANNETGTVQPIAGIVSAVHAAAGARSVWIHTDASQAVGKIPVSVQTLGVDLLTIAGHKLYAPKGIGALYVRQSTVGAQGGLDRFMHGADHERGRRAGTENVMLAAGLGAACAAAVRDLPELVSRMSQLRDDLQSSIITQVAALRSEYGLAELAEVSGVGASPIPARPLVRVHGPTDAASRLPNTLSIAFRGVLSSELLSMASAHVCASSGAACHSGVHAASHVLRAMQVPSEYALGTVRLSVGRFNTVADIKLIAHVLAAGAVRVWLRRARGEDRASAADAHAPGSPLTAACGR
jgi:cysteine desulfurase